MMLPLVALAALFCSLPAAPEPPRPAALLRYDRPVGQIARYSLALEIEGEQISLGERLPVRWKGVIALQEEVVARAPDGAMRMRVTAEMSDMGNADGAFGGAVPRRWPELRLSVSPTGTVIASAPAAGAGAGARERFLASLVTQLGLIALPQDPVGPGDRWLSAGGGAEHEGWIEEIGDSAAGPVARIAARVVQPVTEEEAIPRLGLRIRVSGQARQESQMDLLLAHGVPLRHKGRVQTVTKSQLRLAHPGGEQDFEMAATLTTTFDLRLVSLDGRPLVAGLTPHPPPETAPGA